MCTMINKVNSVSFQSRIPNVKPNNVKRGLKAASIYAASTIAAFALLNNCKEKTKPEPALAYTQLTEVVDTTFRSQIAPNGYYVVKKGDNVWNIAKSLLKEQHPDSELTGPLIDKEKNKIMTLNSLRYPSDSCDVVIVKPGDSLCVDLKVRLREVAEAITRHIVK